MQERTKLEESDEAINLYEEALKDMLADPSLTDEEKQELLRQASLPDNEWEPIELPPGTESMSETIIRMRRETIR